MTPDYRKMARGMTDLGIAAVRVEARLFGRWMGLVEHCGTRFADGLERGDARGGLLSAAGDAASSYVRGAASLPELAMMDLVIELDAVRRRDDDVANRGANGGANGGEA